MNRDLIRKLQTLFHTYKENIIKMSALVLVFAAGCFLAYSAGKQSGQHALLSVDGTQETAAGTPSDAGTLTETPHFEFPPGALYSDATPSNVDLTSPDQLTLAYLYEDGVDTSEPTYSYAGVLYSHLSGLDAKWSSGIYDLYNYTPERMAALMGQPSEAVTSAYGVIPEFKNINVQFLNGDGQAAGSTSNARSIVSMANSMYYYGLLTDMDQLNTYATDLWNQSHSYSAHLGEVYYCDGSCLASGTEEEGNGADGVTEGETDLSGGDSDADGEAASGESETVSERETTAPGAVEAVSGGVATAPDGAATAFAGTASPQSGSDSTAPQADSSDAAQTAQAIESETEAFSQTMTSIGPGETSGADDAGPVSASAADSMPDTGIPADTCPGHIDCTITIVVKGIEETNSLFKTDQTAAKAAGQNGWNGWDDTAAERVRYLSGQGWYEEYGINTTDLFVRNPLTSAEIDIYMSMVPADSSRTKKDFIRYALSSVGKIPYYWGGKPRYPGYTGNNFGSVTTPDEDGRFLSGLDCSGWINWVYWSATGRGLGAASTGTLLSSGRAVNKEELVPGDICIRTGPSAHVVIFLGWASDGKMLCIQETSGNVNNVEVGIAASDWQSYRRIIE